MPLYEIYITNRRTGDKRKLGQATASSPKRALEKYFRSNNFRKGNYLVIPHNVRSKYTVPVHTGRFGNWNK